MRKHRINLCPSTTLFLAGTQIAVSRDGKTVNIEDIRIGDSICSYDLEKKEFYESVVLSVWSNKSCAYTEIRLDDGTTVRCAPCHMLLSDKGWRPVHPGSETDVTEYTTAGLSVGDSLVTENGLAKILSFDTVIVENSPAYTLSVVSNNGSANNCNYVANGVVVH